MDLDKVKVDFDFSDLDKMTEKVERLLELLREANNLLNQLGKSRL